MILIGKSLISQNSIEVSISDSSISSLVTRENDLSEHIILPGFLDIQVNGCCGIDYSSELLEVKDILTVVKTLAKRGTTRHLPTIVTNSHDRVSTNLKCIAEALSQLPLLQEAIPGIHLEGPYISSEVGPRGAHNPEYIRDPNFEELTAWQEASRGAIRMITLAPERKGALDFIEQCSGQGILVAIGHTAADPGLIREAVAAGARLSTHLGNGSHSKLPRLENYLWEQLAADELYASIICDGFHTPPSFIKTVFRTKPTKKIILISDVTALAGKPPGFYDWGSMQVKVEESGRIGLVGTPFLAGAGHDLYHGIHYLQSCLGYDLRSLVEMCTINPAEMLKLPRISPEPRLGGFANLSLCRWDKNSNLLEFKTVVLGNTVLYQQ
ncbi:MAG: N-acetylglucosamine-6-phosphate deacetylase [Bacteroidetes bacterium]|nr:N-acetylglucosamine-6-phosphate deacetylase [Bacteroidota bacterium]